MVYIIMYTVFCVYDTVYVEAVHLVQAIEHTCLHCSNVDSRYEAHDEAQGGLLQTVNAAVMDIIMGALQCGVNTRAFFFLQSF